MRIIPLISFIILSTIFSHCSGQKTEKIPPPTGLLCDLLRQPEKAVITDSIPEFGWVFPTGGKMQEAYRILVASSPGLLTEDLADIWDSEVVKSDQSIDVGYKGKSLEPNNHYYWKVKVWGENNTMSEYSEIQNFNTGEFSDRDLEWPGQSNYVELEKDQWVSEDRQTATFHSILPVLTSQKDEQHYFADFGKAAFGTLELELTIESGSAALEVYLGERKTPELAVNKTPGVSNIGFQKVELKLNKGTHTVKIELPKHYSRSPHSQQLAPFYPEVLPFRFIEIIGLNGSYTIKDLRQLALIYPFDDNASFCKTDNQNLNKVWELCKYTLKATPFLGVYADGNRERMPYEADAYIQQLGHYAVDREFSIARYSTEFLIYHSSWPTEWQMHTVFMAWEDYMHTGNTEFIQRSYTDLKAKTLLALSREDGLISSRDGKVTPEFLQSIYFNGNNFRDNIDWPKGTDPGKKQANNAGPTPEGERDGYVFTDYNTVINAFHYRSLLLMGKMAEAIDSVSDGKYFTERAMEMKESFMNVFFDTSRGIFRDGEDTDHSSLHANMFPLAFGLVPEENINTVLRFIKSRGMACSVYGAQYLLEGLFHAADADYALDLMTSDDKRSWLNMLKVGSTMTTEAWDEYYKPNLTWNHAWGSAPANIMLRKVMGIEALEPGFQKFRICPQPGYLDSVIIRKPCIRGEIYSELVQTAEGWDMEIKVPGNTLAELWLPDKFSSVMINDERIRKTSRVYYAGGKRNVFMLKGGTFTISAKKQ